MATTTARNAMELVTQAMANEVILIMAERNGLPRDNRYVAKVLAGLRNSLDWLDAYVGELNVARSARVGTKLDYFEVCLFCLIEHLAFTHIVEVGDCTALIGYQRDFRARHPAVQLTDF